MAQDTGKIVQWLKTEGEQVTKGQPIVEVETDKATVELEAPADGMLSGVVAREGDDVPVGQIIATILAPREIAQGDEKTLPVQTQTHETQSIPVAAKNSATNRSAMPPSRLASRIADEHSVDLNLVTPTGKRIQKADVLAYLQNQQAVAASPARPLASPKARRLAAEQGKAIATIKGTGPDNAVLAADVLAALATLSPMASEPLEIVAPVEEANGSSKSSNGLESLTLSTTWRIMAERTTQSWTSVPHFFLVREVRANRLIAWREQVLKRSSEKVTYTDLLVKIVAAALRAHPRLNATWSGGTIVLQEEVNVGLAAAIEDGLVVPVIHRADELSLNGIAKQRKDLVSRAQVGKLRPQDLQGGTFTISNLGMYGVDTFNAIINAPQAAILAVGRMAEKVIPVNGQPAVQPVMMLALSCDHRVVDGARGAQFLAMVAELIEEPLGIVG
jgi:pyruvate dehydrogenase E2 component (dihydrolipoamide acetyltransferase)